MILNGQPCSFFILPFHHIWLTFCLIETLIAWVQQERLFKKKSTRVLNFIFSVFSSFSTNSPSKQICFILFETYIHLHTDKSCILVKLIFRLRTAYFSAIMIAQKCCQIGNAPIYKYKQTCVTLVIFQKSMKTREVRSASFLLKTVREG